MFKATNWRLRHRTVVIGASLLGVMAVSALFFPPRGVEAAALIVFGAAVLAAAYRPQWALFIFIVGLPLHNLLMASLYHATDNGTFVKLVQPWKEVVLAVALARVGILAFTEWRRTRRLHLTFLDGLVIAFAALCAISVVLPNHLITLTGRLYGFRDLVVPFGVYTVGRLSPLSLRQVKAVVSAIGAIVLVLSLAAIGERVLWGQALLHTIDYGTYLHNFLGQTFPIEGNIPYTFFTAGWLPRTGSLTLGPLDLANLILITAPILIAVASLRQLEFRRVQIALMGLAAFLGGCALVLAFGRESLVLLPVSLLLIAFVGGLRRHWPAVGVALCGMILGLVLVLATDSFVLEGQTPHARQALSSQGLVTLMHLSSSDLATGRISSTNSHSIPATSGSSTPGSPGSSVTGAANQLFQLSAGSNNASTQGHVQSLKLLLQLMIQHPFGYGIGTAGQVGNRFGTGIGGETSYLTVGAELGFLGLFLYLAVFSGMIFASWQAFRSRVSPLQRALFLGVLVAWIAIAIDGVLAEVTLDLFVMYVLSWLAGAAVSQARKSRIAVEETGDIRAQRPLRIAIDVQALQTARTGVRTYLDEILGQFGQPGIPHRLVQLHGPKRLPNTARVFRIINQLMYLVWLHLWLPFRLAIGNYDAVLSPEYITPVWVPVARVVVAHDAAFLQRPQDYNKLWLLMFKWLTLPAIRRADAVIAPSQYTASELARLGRISQNRIIIVPLGGVHADRPIDVDVEVARQVVQRYGLQPNKYIIHVGVLERRKNLVTLVRAFGILKERGMPPEWKLVLVGQPGPRPDLNDADRIQQTIREMHLDDSVILTGHVPAIERDALYSEAKVIAIPSILEGFGIPVLEGFAAQVPLVVSRATSLPEVAGDAVLLFDPESPAELADAIMKVVFTPELGDHLVEAGRKRLLEFSWAHTAAETLAAVEVGVMLKYGPALQSASISSSIQVRADKPTDMLAAIHK